MINTDIFFIFNNLTHQSVTTDWLIVFFANTLGNILIFLALIYLAFYLDGHFDRRNFSIKYNFKERFIKSVFVFSSAVIAWGITTVIKSIISSPRPFIVYENLKPLFIHGGLDSFPSGHATFFGALAISIYILNKRVGLFFIVGALLVGLARIAAGVHFPIDIMFGYLIGISIPLILNLIFKPKNQ